MAAQLADYEVTATVLDDGTMACLSAARPARLGPGSPMTVWALGPVARSPWPGARARLEAAATARGEGLPDWVEAGVSDWGGRQVVWASATGVVSGTLAGTGLDVRARLAALAQAAHGAHALHERGVLHAAICPQAIATTGTLGTTGGMLAPPALADGQDLTVQVGYPPLAYVDPQLLRGAGGRWSDIWGLGATLHHAVTGHPPFPNLDDVPVVQALAQMLSTPAPALDGVPAPASDLVAACLSADPQDRPATAAEVARRIDELAAGWEAGAHA